MRSDSNRVCLYQTGCLEMNSTGFVFPAVVPAPSETTNIRPHHTPVTLIKGRKTTGEILTLFFNHDPVQTQPG